MATVRCDKGRLLTVHLKSIDWLKILNALRTDFHFFENSNKVYMFYVHLIVYLERIYIYLTKKLGPFKSCDDNLGF